MCILSILLFYFYTRDNLNCKSTVGRNISLSVFLIFSPCFCQMKCEDKQIVVNQTRKAESDICSWKFPRFQMRRDATPPFVLAHEGATSVHAARVSLCIHAKGFLQITITYRFQSRFTYALHVSCTLMRARSAEKCGGCSAFLLLRHKMFARADYLR